MKALELTALDGSKWHIPVEVIAASYRAYYPTETEYPGDEEIIDWAENNMNWSDVKAHAARVAEADPVNMQDSWIEGEMTVVEVAEPEPFDPLKWKGPLPSMATPATLQPIVEPEQAPAAKYRCKRCERNEIDARENGCERAPCPMELVDVRIKAEYNGAPVVLRIEGAVTVDACATIARHVALDPDAVAARLTDADLLNVYKRMDGHALAAKHQPESLGDAILVHYAREAIRAAVTRATEAAL